MISVNVLHSCHIVNKFLDNNIENTRFHTKWLQQRCLLFGVLTDIIDLSSLTLLKNKDKLRIIWLILEGIGTLSVATFHAMLIFI